MMFDDDAVRCLTGTHDQPRFRRFGRAALRNGFVLGKKLAQVRPGLAISAAQVSRCSRPIWVEFRRCAWPAHGPPVSQADRTTSASSSCRKVRYNIPVRQVLRAGKWREGLPSARSRGWASSPGVATGAVGLKTAHFAAAATSLLWVRGTCELRRRHYMSTSYRCQDRSAPPSRSRVPCAPLRARRWRRWSGAPDWTLRPSWREVVL